MKTEKKLFLAFILNFSFSIFELVGGMLTGSIAILSDAVHDVGDAFAIGLSYFFERKSKKEPDKQYSYGYGRFSVLGGGVTTLVLLLSSVIVIYHAVARIINPVKIDYNGMIVFAIVGVVVNLIASYVTNGGHSINLKAVNLHMIEDVLGWVVVLIGAVLMGFTDLTVLDSLMSIGVALFILKHAIKHIISIARLFCEKVPEGISVSCIKDSLILLPGISDVHHIHIWSRDGEHHYATMHLVISGKATDVKTKVRDALKQYNILHVTIETESEGECCREKHCMVKHVDGTGCHCHHH